jgi:hypothetical protein
MSVQKALAKGVFGWAVALKKAVVGCELWKKLLWVMSCEKAESRLVENCYEASFFFEISNVGLEKLPNFQNFKF